MPVSKEKEFNIEKSVETFLQVLEKLGLELTEKSGGALDSDQDISSVNRSKNLLDIELKTHEGNTIKIEDGKYFLEAVKRSEEQLNVKLFI